VAKRLSLEPVMLGFESLSSSITLMIIITVTGKSLPEIGKGQPLAWEI